MELHWHTIAIFASSNTEGHTVLAKPGRHDWANLKGEPAAAAFSEDIGDSAVSFPLTGTGNLDHVLIPFARDRTLARATFRPTLRACPTTQIVVAG